MEEKQCEWLSLTKEDIDKSFDSTKVKVLKDTGLKGLIEIEIGRASCRERV